MLNIETDTQFLTEFKRRTKLFIEQLQGRKRLIVLTIHEVGAVVVRDVLAYEKLLDCLKELQPARSVLGNGRSAGGCS